MVGGGRQPLPKGSRSGLSAKWCFGGLGYQGQKTTPFQERTGLLVLPPSAARPINQYVLGKVWFLGFGTSGVQNSHVANKPLRDPSDFSCFHMAATAKIDPPAGGGERGFDLAVLRDGRPVVSGVLEADQTYGRGADTETR